MDNQAKVEILGMLNSFPQSGRQNGDALLHGFEVACDGFSWPAIVNAAKGYIKGTVPQQSLQWPPSTAEFANEVRRQEGFIDARIKYAALPAPRQYKRPARLPFEIRADKAHRNMIDKGYERIDGDMPLEKFKAAKYPVGTMWIGANQSVYQRKGDE